MNPRTAVKEPETIGLYFQQGSSDKVYQLQLEGVDEQWSVNAKWGRRGSALQSDAKVSSVAYEESQRPGATPPALLAPPVFLTLERPLRWPIRPAKGLPPCHLAPLIGGLPRDGAWHGSNAVAPPPGPPSSPRFVSFDISFLSSPDFLWAHRLGNSSPLRPTRLLLCRFRPGERWVPSHNADASL